MVHRYVRYKRPWAYYIDFILLSNLCVLNEGAMDPMVSWQCAAMLNGWSLQDDIISGVGHLRADSVVLLVLCIVVYNDLGTGIILQVPQDNINSAENQWKS